MTTQEVPAQQLGAPPQWGAPLPLNDTPQWGTPPQLDNRAAPRQAARSASRRTRRRVIGLCIALAVAAGAIFFLVAVVVPYASAAGGCGGG
jgi:hypothetical protein